MKIKREILGQTIEIELTDAELRDLYYEARKDRMAKYIATTLVLYGYPEQVNKTLMEMTDHFLDLMDGGKNWTSFAGRLRHECSQYMHECFQYMMENFYPEIKVEEE